MISFVTTLKARPGAGAALEALLAHVRDMTRRHEPDVVHYDFGADADVAGGYAVIEAYRHAEAHAAHMRADWVRASLPRVLDLIEGRPDVKQYVAPGTPPARRRMEDAMPDGDAMGDLERLVALAAIQRLKGRRDHAVDRKDWDGYAALHTDDYVAMSISAEPVVGGRAAADALARHLANVVTVHHCHTPVIDFVDRDNATGVWAMEDNLFWHRDGERQWLRGFGFYHERYVRGADGEWRFSYRRLERTHAETSPGAASLAFDAAGDNPLFGLR